MTDDRTAIIAEARGLASKYESENRGCAQAVLAALQDVFHMRDDDVFRAASGLSGGVGLSTRGTCGALSGGAMAIGMLFGRERKDFRDPGGMRRITYRLCNALCMRFEAEYGSVICSKIQERHLGRSFDLWNPDEYGKFDEVAYRQGRCPDLVGNGAAWAAEIIIEELEARERS